MELTVNDLRHAHETVYPARTKWYNIGLQLDVPVDTLDSIEREKGDDGDHLRNMLKWWLKRGGATWGALADALKSPTVGECLLAKKLDVRAQGQMIHTDRLEPNRSGSARKRPRPQHQLLTEDEADTSSRPPPRRKKAIPPKGGATSSPAPVKPLRFDPRCGINVEVEVEGNIVCHHSNAASYSVARTNRPLKTEELFEIEILATTPSHGLAFGVTTHSIKEVMDSAMYMHVFKSDTWMLDWQGRAPRDMSTRNHVVMVNGIGAHRHFASWKVLSSLKPAAYVETGTWFQSKPVKDEAGDKVALRITQTRNLVFYINGEKKGIVASDIPEGVYGFVELIFTGVKVELVPHE